MGCVGKSWGGAEEGGGGGVEGCWGEGAVGGDDMRVRVWDVCTWD